MGFHEDSEKAKNTSEGSVSPKKLYDSQNAIDSGWNHSTHDAFFEYYKEESVSPSALQRFRGIRDSVLRVYSAVHSPLSGPLDVADIGCGAGTQGALWAQYGHQVYGIDVNEPLVELARERARNADIALHYWVGSASNLPWEEASMDVCLLPELLEHVSQWQQCLDECARILRPGGLLFLSTTNKLCPKQSEFKLPCYSWYPTPLKRYCEYLAATTRPEIAGYATYPAVNWFTPAQLRKELAQRGFNSFDRFDMINHDNSHNIKYFLISLIRKSTLIRWFALAATPYTKLIGVKGNDTTSVRA